MCTGITSYYESVSPNSIGLWWRPESDKFPGDTHAAGPWTTLWVAGKRPLQKWLKGSHCWCGGQRQDSSHQPLPSFSKSSLFFDVLRLSSSSDQLWIKLITNKDGVLCTDHFHESVTVLSVQWLMCIGSHVPQRTTELLTISQMKWTTENLNVLSRSVLSYPLWPPMDHSPPGSSVLEILQARMLEWVAIPFSRGFSWPRDRTHLSSGFQADSLPLSHQGSPESLKDLAKVTPLKSLGSNPASFPSQVCSKNHVPGVQKVMTISSTAGVLKSPWWLKGVPCIPDVFANLVVCIEIWST